MHILIFARTQRTAEELRAALGDPANRYTIANSWPDALSCIEDDSPDLALVERTALGELESAALSRLMEPGRWPPIILADAPAADIKDKIAPVFRLTRQTHPHAYQIGDLYVDTRKKRVGIGGRWVTLPPLQYRLLLALARRAGEVVSYRELLRAVWGYEGEDNEARELLKVHIRQIRRRLGLDPEEHHYIRSVRGFGYMLTAPEEE